MTECNMVPGNRLELTSAADLDREEERISKKRALALFDTGLRDKLNASTVVSLQSFNRFPIISLDVLICRYSP